MNKNNIVYYYVPQNRSNYQAISNKLIDKTLDNWSEVIIKDAHSIYETRTLSEKLLKGSFIDDERSFAKILWSMKLPDENIIIKWETGILKKKYFQEKVNTIEELIMILEKRGTEIKKYAVNYMSNRINKIIYSECCETLYVFLDNEYKVDFEKRIKCWADKVSYSVYELGDWIQYENKIRGIQNNVPLKLPR